MITQVVTGKDVESVFEKEIVVPVRKIRFTIKQKEAEKVRLQAMINAIDADIAEATAVKE